MSETLAEELIQIEDEALEKERIRALHTVMSALMPLDQEGRQRVLAAVAVFFELDKGRGHFRD